MLKVTEVLQAKVKATVTKTGKSYYRTRNYAKHVIKEPRLGKPAIHEYYLREGRGWKPVSEAEFNKATTEEAVQKLHEQLSQELRQRVEKIMSKQ